MLLIHPYLLLLLSLFQMPTSSKEEQDSKSIVQIFHIIDNALWGEVDGSFLQGNFYCGRFINCTVLSSDSKSDFLARIKEKYRAQMALNSLQNIYPVTVSLYNIHTWKALANKPYYPSCDMPTHLSIAESEESYARFRGLFDMSFPHFDGNSTTHPKTSVQRTYIQNLNASHFLPMKLFSNLIRGASFVASTCHRSQGTVKREVFVGPEGITLSVGSTALESLQLKQKAISNYLFYLAFENTIEPGYVTEKVFDALIAGVVPVYLGAAADCKKLLPKPNAAIFLEEFDHNIPKLVEYLEYLSKNESAYEDHRSWRRTFDPSQMSHLVTKSWPCRVCEWAVATQREGKAGQSQSPTDPSFTPKFVSTSTGPEGSSPRGVSRKRKQCQ